MNRETEKLLSEYGYEPSEEEMAQRLLIRERARKGNTIFWYVC